MAHHGVDHERFRPLNRPGADRQALEDAGVPLDRPLVVFVGTLEPRKGVVPLIGAFDRLADRERDAVLVLAGQPGWGLEETELALASARHADRIVRTGYVPDATVPALLRQAAVAACPALEEGFGLPALEALACGAPLVTTEGTAMAEVAEGAATLVPPGSVTALADALGAPSALAQSASAGVGHRGAHAVHLGGQCRPVTARRMRWPWRPRSRVPRMRALITGGKGFVGHWLAAHLKDGGDEVAAIDIETDVADGAAVQRVMADVAPDAIYHLAAMTHVGESWEDPSQVLRVNVLGTAEVLAAARSLPGSPRVLVVSSAEVYGVVSPEQLPLGEDTPPPRRAPTPPASWPRRRWHSRPGGASANRCWSCGPSTTSDPGSRPTSSSPHWPSASSRPSDRERAPFRSDTHHPPRLHRRARRRSGLPPSGGTGRAGHRLQRLLRTDVAMSEVAAELLSLAGADLTFETDPALVRPVDVPVLRGDAGLLHGATGWAPSIPLATTLADVLSSWEAD